MLFFAVPLRKLASARASPAPSPSPITNRRAAIYRGLVEADGFRLSAAADAHSMIHAPPPRRKTAVETSAMAVPSVRTLWERTRQLAALIEGGADHPGRSFLGPQRPPNFGSVSWRWLCRLKWASGEKAGLFACAFQRVAIVQNLPFADLAVLPAGLLRRV